MEIEPIKSATAYSPEAAHEALRLATERRSREVQESNKAAAASTANVTTSPTFAPAFYAQAAQFQLYTQAGVLASLVPQAHPPTATSNAQGVDDIKPVDPAEGGRVDTRA